MNEHIGFNPRGQANSNALSDFVVADLRALCRTLSSAIGSGRLKPLKNPDVHTKVSERSVDLVIAENGGSPAISVRISVEHKTIMTAHGKARKNRYGDIIAYSNHMHNHRRHCIAGGIVVIKISPKYDNPYAFAKGLERPDYNMYIVVIDMVGII